MSIDLPRDVFQPVAERVISRGDSLIGLERKLKCFSTLGLEGWLKIEAIRAWGPLVSRICNKGKDQPPCKTPDVELKYDESSLWIELKGCNDLNIGYLHSGVTDHLDFPGFAGCIFLGDARDKMKIDRLTNGKVQLLEAQTFPAGKEWIIGLLTARST